MKIKLQLADTLKVSVVYPEIIIDTEQYEELQNKKFEQIRTYLKENTDSSLVLKEIWTQLNSNKQCFHIKNDLLKPEILITKL